MAEQIPVNPCVLRWARETSGYTTEELVKKFARKKITVDVINAWEKGIYSPSYAQLERLAYEIFKRPLALFFFPEPPEEETPKESFRTLPREEIDFLDPRLLYLIRKAKAKQENLKELFEGVNPAQKQIWVDVVVKRSDTISQVATTVRNYFGVHLGTQYSWKSNDEALKYWRNLLEEHGVFVFKDAFKEEDCSGFCLYDPVFPLIYINNSQPKIRQIFTLFHELAHLLFKVGGVDFRSTDFIEKMSGDNKHIEMFCNKFAGEFLVPSKDIKPQLQNQTIDDAILSRLAAKFSVSREVILRKCLDLDFISSIFYEKKVKEWEGRKQEQKDSRSDYYRTQGAYLSDRYIDAVFSRYYQGKISKSELADFLDMKESNIDKFEGYVLHKEG